MQEKYGFVYIWRDRKYKKYYIGCHWGHEDDGYICSSNYMRSAYNRRPHDFKRRTLKRIATKKEAFFEEYRILQLIKQEELGNRYYNRSNFNYYNSESLGEMSAETRKIISQNSLKMWSDPVFKEKMKLLKANVSVETREKISKIHKGRPKSEETKLKMSLASKGKPKTPEHAIKCAIAALGRKPSESTKARKKISMMKYHDIRLNLPSVDVIKHLVEKTSISEVARLFNTNRQTIRNRL